MPLEYKLAPAPTVLDVVEAGPAGAGTVMLRAIVATLDVVDLDGDTYEPGAFAGADEVFVSPWNHSSVLSGGQPPVGQGVIREVGRHAIFEGTLWLASSAGRDVYELLRQRGPRQQWSYTYDVLRSRPGTVNGERVRVLQRLAVHEASPVWQGAGGTGAHTLAVSGDVDQAAAEYLRFVALRHGVGDVDDQAATEYLRFAAHMAGGR